MIPYVILLVVITLLSIPLNCKRILGYKELYLFSCIVILTLFSGLASSRGDYNSYRNIFNNIFDGSYVEIGFQLLNKLVLFLGGGYHLLLIVIALFSVSTKLYAFTKLTPYFGIATIAYVGSFFVPADMGSIRFGIAMSFFLLSLKYVKEQRFGKFIFVTLLGCTFHSALIVSVLLYILCNFINLKKKHYIIILLLSIMSYLFIDIAKIILFTQKIIPAEYNVFLRVLNYMDMKAHFNFAMMKRVSIMIIITVFYQRMKDILPYFKVLYNAYFLSIVTFFLFSLSFYLANRTSWLFACVEPILLSGLIKLSNNNTIKTLIFIGIVLYSLINICSIVITQTDPPFNLYLPYNLFFL